MGYLSISGDVRLCRTLRGPHQEVGVSRGNFYWSKMLSINVISERPQTFTRHIGQETTMINRWHPWEMTRVVPPTLPHALPLNTPTIPSSSHTYLHFSANTPEFTRVSLQYELGKSTNPIHTEEKQDANPQPYQWEVIVLPTEPQHQKACR